MQGSTVGATKGDTRSLDFSSCDLIVSGPKSLS